MKSYDAMRGLMGALAKWLVGAWVAIGAAGCGGDQCFDDRSCGPGNRCTFNGGDPGICEPCDAFEVPYDLTDNDCDPTTRDDDVDGDGQPALLVGGLDCNDNDPTIMGGADARETCGDGKDNDCDQMIDEIDCADFLPPTARFELPRPESIVAGTIPVRIRLSDDVQLGSLTLSRGNEVLGNQTFNTATATYETTVDTTSWTDGPHTLQVRVTDIASRSAVDTVVFVVDNLPGPNLTILNPPDNIKVDGTMTIAAVAEDRDGISSIEARFDGLTVATGAPGAQDIRTTVTVSDVNNTQHFVEIEAVDQLGNPTLATARVRVDTTSPSIVFVSPAPGTVIDQPTVVTVRATDASGLALLSSEGQEVRGQPGETELTLSYTLDPATFPRGQRELTATAIDTTRVNDRSGHSTTATLRLGSPATAALQNCTQTPGNTLYMDGDERDPVVNRPGDYIHPGRMTYSAGQWSASTSSDRQPNPDTVSIFWDGPFATEWYSLAFSSRQLQRELTVGVYSMATRYPFETGVPGLDISGSGRGCNRLSGEFEIHSIRTSTDSFGRFQLDEFAATFIQHCEMGVAQLRGCVDYTRGP